MEVALRKGPMTAEEEAASGDRTLGDEEEVEECGTLVVPFIKELQPALRALCTRLNLKLLYYKRTVNLWAICWLLGDRPLAECSRRMWSTRVKEHTVGR